eukprot:CAMPEP_0204891588 /NCGR_PEP_ID=MMETSP1349-20130617/27576_1 /ASSEMBLY_ACC=CAM_ASM_000710 /TAXON_ID=215587 /ORGANISM="Aplanochytrium stocchinoi, Strain GSBS06" /LENGTH=133 /DNA_ID=CAMNT_0052057035 /DNA_START=116 /DNA_END=517 /DNA_ORIENTATION=-
MSDKLDALGRELHKLREEQEENREKLLAKVNQEKKQYMKHHAQVLKTRSKYIRACKDVEKLVMTREKSLERDSDKLSQKLENAMEEVGQLQAVHWIGCTTFREFQRCHRYALEQIMKELEALVSIVGPSIVFF